jgi:hypothetical protein
MYSPPLPNDGLAGLVNFEPDSIIIVRHLGDGILPLNNVELPRFLQPRGYGSYSIRNPVYEFPDLSHYAFSADDKISIVDIILRHDEGVFYHAIGDTGKNCKSVANAYNINSKTLNDWKLKILNDKTIKKDGGRPKIFSKHFIDEVKTAAKDGVNASKPLLASRIKDSLKRKIEEDALKSGKGVVQTQFSESTLKRARKEALSSAKASNIAIPRVRAAQDIRNFYSMYCAMQACKGGVENARVINADNTIFECKKDKTDAKVIVVKQLKKEDYHDDNGDFIDQHHVPAAIVAGDHNQAFYVKWMACVNHPGESIPFVFLIAIEELGIDEFHHFEVKTLRWFVNAPPGHLCFTKTRAGNRELYDWFFRSIIIPFIKGLSTPLNEGDDSLPSIFTLDGEKTILDSLMGRSASATVEQLPSIIDLMNENRTRVVKTPASASLVLQALDVSVAFRIIKKKLKSTIEGGLAEKIYPDLERELDKVITQFVAFKELKEYSETKSKIIQAVSRIYYAIKHSLKPEHLTKGFEHCGQGLDERGDFNLYGMLQNKRGSRVTSEQYNYLLDRAKSTDIALMMTNGKITEENMDNSNATIVINTKPVEVLPRSDINPDKVEQDMILLFKQRAVILSNTRNILAYNAESGAGEGSGEGEKELSREEQTKMKQMAQGMLRKEATEKKKAEERAKFSALPVEEQDKIREKEKQEKIRKKTETERLKALAKQMIESKKVTE